MLPLFVAPVLRPEVVQPFLTVNLKGGTPEQVLHVIFDLIHGANYNSPQCFLRRDYSQLKSSLVCAAPLFGRFRG
jgi:cyanobactin biosynthesis protein (PatB/AcyB/McaB family)